MSTSLLYHAFGIVGYHYRSQHFHEGTVTFRIEQPRDRLRCAPWAAIVRRLATS